MTKGLPPWHHRPDTSHSQTVLMAACHRSEPQVSSTVLCCVVPSDTACSTQAGTQAFNRRQILQHGKVFSMATSCSQIGEKMPCKWA